ncbi:alpha/beta hydrolase [Ramlibacter sp. G-1-2-2]|uniref:Alpha/beta hydrolase n=1 Tax=Ramlibacter agri TaxID=2728837 RepID=A0A848H3V9_9BURK|nr:alpha/beta hydrolase [Ramlibacter agri]NML42448.1 alpha/beta hydrolase [Ramlibacter agri]
MTREATAGYYQASTGIRLFRMALATSQRLWPALAVRAATRLFGTPLPPKWLNRRTAWGPGWQAEHWPFEDANLTLYLPRAESNAPLALLVHGWGGHAGQLRALAEALLQQGLQPVLLEMPAHGRSAGLASNLPQFARAIEYTASRLRQQGHELRLLAAHSLGANAAAFAASRGLPVERMALLAPPASPREYTRYFAHVFGLSETTRSAMQKRIEEREAILMPSFEPASVGPRIDVPVLVVHDRGDRVNPFRDGQAFAAAIAGARLVATDGLGHRKMLREESVIAEVLAFACAP